MVAKVLHDSGSGAASRIIAGMQWAVDNKVDAVQTVDDVYAVR